MSDPHVVLLVGEVGTGKTTFVNCIASYLKYNHPDMKKTIMVVENKDFETNHKEPSGTDEKQTFKERLSSKDVKMYEFTKKFSKFVFIDTPGLRPEDDENSMDKIVDCLSNFKHLSAICIVVDNNSSASTFEPLVNLLSKTFDLSKLKDNVFFLFTKSRPPDYNIPKDFFCLPCLSSNSIVCLDNQFLSFYLQLPSQTSDDATRAQMQSDMENIKQSYTHSQITTNNLLENIKKKTSMRMEDCLIGRHLNRYISRNLKKGDEKEESERAKNDVNANNTSIPKTLPPPSSHQSRSISTSHTKPCVPRHCVQSTGYNVNINKKVYEHLYELEDYDDKWYQPITKCLLKIPNVSFYVDEQQKTAYFGFHSIETGIEIVKMLNEVLPCELMMDHKKKVFIVKSYQLQESHDQEKEKTSSEYSSDFSSETDEDETKMATTNNADQQTNNSELVDELRLLKAKCDEKEQKERELESRLEKCEQTIQTLQENGENNSSRCVIM